MAADLNVRVIAEGAENLKHVNLLTELGCDMAQGYELGRPQMRPQIEELLAGIQASTEQRRR
jgi:EAL domain-containing protein (putative c-di-GMP-specific phosphodiesterase class I)